MTPPIQPIVVTLTPTPAGCTIGIAIAGDGAIATLTPSVGVVNFPLGDAGPHSVSFVAKTASGLVVPLAVGQVTLGTLPAGLKGVMGLPDRLDLSLLVRPLADVSAQLAVSAS